MYQCLTVFLLMTIFLPLQAEAALFDTKDNRRPISSDNYPYRAIGRLTLVVKSGKSFDCTAFLTGPNKIMTARHCVIEGTRSFKKNGKDIEVRDGTYLKEVKFELLLSNNSKLNGPYTVPVNKTGEWKIYKSAPRNIRIPKDFIELTLPTNLGDEVGYFGTRGLSNSKKINPGSPGELENNHKAAGEQALCQKSPEISPLKDLAVAHKSMVRGEEPNWVEPPEDEELKVCAASLPSDYAKKYKRDQLAVEACYLAGVWDNALAHDCSANGGASGSPIFYYDKDFKDAKGKKGTYFAIAVHAAAYTDKLPDSTPFSDENFNYAPFITPDFLDLNE